MPAVNEGPGERMFMSSVQDCKRFIFYCVTSLVIAIKKKKNKMHSVSSSRKSKTLVLAAWIPVTHKKKQHDWDLMVNFYLMHCTNLLFVVMVFILHALWKCNLLNVGCLAQVSSFFIFYIYDQAWSYIWSTTIIHTHGVDA